ncbi:MAG TPA: SAM-dependent chlorinase/fluorinase [Vicinamibacterales bacterium]|nr:SAM-dependent chlorinase/fluorinase [Vicinamibacterales bacterium]
MKPVIALLTDFGTRDHYVGAMRGVALGICPDATLADITHDIAPQDVLGGALELAAAFTYFPHGTVFLCVVDPGVGSARRGIGVEAGGYRFIAPDNGLLTLVFRECPPTRVVELTEPQYARAEISRTFEGRDRFAPAAAWLARGTDLGALGPPLASWQLLDVPEPRVQDGQISGVVLRVDRFGNLITNIDRRSVQQLAGGRRIIVEAAGRPVPDVVETYAEAAPGSICALFGSSGHLEIAINGGSAAASLGLSRGAPLSVRLKADSTG